MPKNLSEITQKKVWGWFEVLFENKDMKIKKITVLPNQRLSLQKHFKRSEHWYVLSGDAFVLKGDIALSLGSGESVNIACEEWHRIANYGKENLVFIEVQTGEYFGEDDIERKADDYGRA